MICMLGSFSTLKFSIINSCHSIPPPPPPRTRTADIAGICDSPDIPNGVFPQDCATTTCACPLSQFVCPQDSVITVTRVDGCCLSYECVCPDISCPYLMERGTGLQPVPQYRGNLFPGRCCPSYDYLGEPGVLM